MKKPKGQTPEDRINTIIEAAMEGISQQKIGDFYGVSRQAIGQILKRYLKPAQILKIKRVKAKNNLKKRNEVYLGNRKTLK